MMRHCLLAMLVLLLGCDRPQSDPDAKAPSAKANVRADYEFQERCGKAAADWFKTRYKDGSEKTNDGQSFSDFSNHYNRKLNKCFVLAAGTTFTKDSMLTWQQLHDVHENKQYGDFLQNSGKGWAMCNVLQAPCTSSDEWDKLTKPYMED